MAQYKYIIVIITTLDFSCNVSQLHHSIKPMKCDDGSWQYCRRMCWTGEMMGDAALRMLIMGL